MNGKNVLAIQPRTNHTVEQALHAAKLENLSDAIIVGYDQQGSLVAISSRMSHAEVLFLLRSAERWVMEPDGRKG